MSFLEKIFGSYSDKEIKRIVPLARAINQLEEQASSLTDDELREKTVEFKERVAEGETLNSILPEAFAVVREAAVRTLNMRHFDVQLIGGIVLHQGRIAEMKTGEGKTMVATLPVYLNALTGNGVHVVTVNDYLAKRDSEWMGKIYNFLGLTVGTIFHGLSNEQRRAAYNCDITYATNNELGFDYLRDNMVIYKENKVQRELNYAIVDEVDSILIDEARTPLIISGQGDKSTDMYTIADNFVRRLKALKILKQDDKEVYDDIAEDYLIDEKGKSCALTARGIKKAEEFFKVENLADPENATVQHHINIALRAHGIMKRDIDYVVKDGEVIIVDEFTGRLMHGRRYNDGLHQAIEAKEGVTVERESMTQATITFQNFFRMYKKLSGMTGTAKTEEVEFNDIYKLDVIIIPTNMPLIRKDDADYVYKSEKGKFEAVIEDIIDVHSTGQPILIGTITIETSELLSSMLRKKGIRHNVLNAKHHEREAEIVAQAGKFGAVTIATNMAGRGTDIKLGGNEEFLAKQEMRKLGFSDELINESTGHDATDDTEILNARKTFSDLEAEFKKEISIEKEDVIKAGGLYIIGTERHESRRIDNQLRGRSGRQGDPGKSRFYISLEDDLMRLFGSERIQRVVEALGLPEDQAIENRMLSGAIESAQKRIEGRNYNIRRNVLQYDDVMNTQRGLIYGQRSQVLNGEDMSEYYKKMIIGTAEEIINAYCSETNDIELWDWESLLGEFMGLIDRSQYDLINNNRNGYKKEKLADEITEMIMSRYTAKEEELGENVMRDIERVILLRSVDEKWMDHIDAIDQLRNGIGLRGYAQRDPILEYKFEAFEMFDAMIRNIKIDALKIILNIRLAPDSKIERKQVGIPQKEIRGENTREGGSKVTIKKSGKVGRNEPCPCGSGKKYKACCGG